MLSRLRLGPKLLLAPALVLLLLVLSSGVAYWAMLRQNALLETIVQVRAARIHDATALVAQAQSAHARSYQLLTWIGASVSATRIKALEDDIHRRHAALETRFVELAARNPAGSIERRLLEQAQAAHALHAMAVRDVIELARGDQSVAASAMVKAEHAFDREALRLAALATHEQRQSEAAAQGAAAELGLIRVLMPALAALSILLSLAITVAVRRALLREVSDIGRTAHDLAGGNLTVPARDYGGDEISETSRTLDASIRTLNGTLKEILASARSIDTASRRITTGNADLSNWAGLQASSLEPTRLTMELLGATVSRNAGHALAAHRLAADAAHTAQQGCDAAERAVATMATLMDGAQRLADVISGIASLSSLPALDAAACEMRALVVQIAGVSVAASAAGASMANVAGAVRQIGDVVTRISVSSAEQASGISNINCAIVQMDHMSQENSALVQDAAAAAASLQAQAWSLSQAVAAFKLDESTTQAESGKPRLWLASKRD